MESLARFNRRIILFYKRTSVFTDWRTDYLLELANPILRMFCFCLVSYYVYGQNEIQSWSVSNALLIASFGALYGVGTQLIAEKNNGTLSLLLASPTKMQEIFLSSTASAMISGILSVFAGLSLVSLYFQISWNSAQIFSIVLIIMLSVFVAMSFGFLFACLIFISTEINLIINTVSSLLLIFTGSNFPITDLPYTFRQISYLLPLTRSIYVAQRIVTGESITLYTNEIMQEFILGGLYLLAGLILLVCLEKVSIRTGKIDFM